LQVPKDLIGGLVLGAGGGLLQSKIQVWVRADWYEQLSIYYCAILLSG
jgi:hypothetical protein